jgi:hypothetical protein
MSAAANLVGQPLNADAHLEYTQDQRRRLIQGLMPEATDVKNIDPKLANVILAAMKDMDKVTLTLKRIDADKENSDADREALAQFHRLSALTGSKDLLQSDAGSVREGPPDFDPAEIPTGDHVDGELTPGADPTEYDHFMERERQKRRASLQESGAA